MKPNRVFSLLLLAACQKAPPIVVRLDPCGFADAPAAAIDVSERADLFHADPFSRVDALVQEGPSPSFQQIVAEAGSCRYLGPDYGSCVPACGASEVCTADDVCLAWPAALSGGTLAIEGLGEPVDIEPEDWSAGTYSSPPGLGVPLFASGEPVGATLSGDTFPAVSLGASGVAEMDPDLARTGLALHDGADGEITWTAGPDPDVCVQVVLNGSNTTHGQPLEAVIWCETTDSGRLIVPQELIERFPPGVTPEVSSGYDWPHSELTRYTRSTVDTPYGPARLVVRSTTSFLFDHPTE